MTMVFTSGFSSCLVLRHGTLSNRPNYRAINQGLHAHSNASKKLALLSEVNVPRKSSTIGFAKANAVTSDEFGYPCEDEHEEDLKEFEFEANFSENILPPWGNLDNCEVPDVGGVVSDQKYTVLEEPAIVSVDNVHFLEETDEVILSQRILTLSQTNKPRSALELLNSMELSGLGPQSHACNSLMSCLLRNGLVKEGLRLFGYMKRKKITTGHSCSLILKGVAKARGCNAALDLFREMEEDVDVKSCFDSIVYNTAISLCGRENNWLEAARLWRSMRQSRLGGTRVTYSVLVCTFVRCGQNELALDAYAEMNDLDPEPDAMQAAIGAAAKEGKWEFALSVFESMLRRELVPSLVACNALINSLGKAGEAERALGAFKAMKSLGHRADSYTWRAVLGALGQAGRHGDALRLFGAVADPSLHVFNAALASCSKLGSWERAVQILWRMENSGVKPSTASYNLVIGACETARKPRVALQVYDHMLSDPDTFTRLLILRLCIWGSLWDHVHQILNESSPDGSLYNMAIQGMCLRGKVDLAKKLYAKMQSFGLRPVGKTRALMLQNLRKRPVRRRRSYRQPTSSRQRTLSSTTL